MHLPELSVDPTEAQEGFKDMLELLKELAQESDAQIGMVDPKMWRGPFSENQLHRLRTLCDNIERTFYIRRCNGNSWNRPWSCSYWMGNC